MNREASPPAWWFWASVAVLLVFSQFWASIFVGPSETKTVPPAIAGALRAVYLPAYAVILILVAGRLKQMAAFFVRAPALLALLLLAVGSAAWTIDAELTQRRVLALVLTTLFGVFLAQGFTWAQLTRMFGVVFAAIIALSFAYVLFLPALGVMQAEFPGAWRGVYGEKNALGYAMSVAVSVFAGAFLLNPKERLLWGLAGLAALFLLLMSTSKTALLGGLLAMGALSLLIVGRRGPSFAVAAALLAGTGVYAATVALSLNPGLAFDLLGKDQSFTGRTQIWTEVGKVIAQRPLLGFGYGAVWDNHDLWSPFPAIQKSLGFSPQEAHNTWLQIAVDLGYVGAALWTIVFAAVWARTCGSLATRAAALFVLPFLIAFTLHALTEAGALLQNDVVWVLFTLVSVRLANEGRAARASPAAATGRSHTGLDGLEGLP